MFPSDDNSDQLEASKYVYRFEVIYRNQTTMVQKDLCELVSFAQNVEAMFSGYVDTWLC